MSNGGRARFADRRHGTSGVMGPSATRQTRTRIAEHWSFRRWPQRLRMFGRSVYVGPRPDGRLAGASGQTVEVEQADLAPGHADEPGVLGRPEGLVGTGTGRPGQPGQILLG